MIPSVLQDFGFGFSLSPIELFFRVSTMRFDMIMVI